MSTGSLPFVAGDMLESLGAHRLLLSRQLRALHAPHAGARWTEKVLARLVRTGLVSYGAFGRGHQRVYYLTSEGRQALQAAGDEQAAIPDARYAAGALNAHTIAVNDVGVAFVQAARERDDECGPLAWRHEVAHPLAPGAGRRAERVIADAVLNYLQHTDDGALAFHYRFLELDRATQPTATLAAKLTRYARLFTYTTNNSKEPQWQTKYPVFPEVLIVLTGAPEGALRRRAQTVLAMAEIDPVLQRTPQVAVSTVLLDELVQRGPWEPIFARLHSDRPTTWTGATS